MTGTPTEDVLRSDDALVHCTSRAGGSGGPGGSAWTRLRTPALLALVLLLVFGVVVGARQVLRPAARPSPGSVGQRVTPVPLSAAVEATWGLRFTDVIVVADNGGVELRYQVLDEGKSAKIHQGTGTNNQLPTMQVEASGAKITPSSVLMHFHHGDPTAGRSYSIIYGNAGGAVRRGDFITLTMKDGLTIKHVQVSD